MADITMCKGDGCPKRDGCYRHTATANEYYQSFFVSPPFIQETKECQDFWDNTDYLYERKTK